MHGLLKRLVSLLVNVLVLMLRAVIPKDRKLAVVGGWNGKRFADNSKYFFLDYCTNYRTNYAMYWVTRDSRIYRDLENRGLPVVKAGSLRCVWLHLRARYHIIDHSYDDISGYLSLTAVRINIWHGLPMKKIWRAKSSPFARKLSSFLGDTVYDAMARMTFPGGWSDFRLCIPSDFSAEHIFGECVSKRQLGRSVRCSCPRVDFLRGRTTLPGRDRCNASREQGQAARNSAGVQPALDEVGGEALIGKVKSIHSMGGKVVIYMPTFRDTQRNPLLGANGKRELDDFLNLFGENNFHLFIKPHPEDKALSSVVHKNVVMLPASGDVYPVLKLSDMLVTDYSSVFFDYSVLGKPIIFYVYDYERYKNYDRGILFGFDKFDIAPKVYELGNLFEAIVSEMDDLNYGKKRREFARMVFQDGYPSLNVCLLRRL